MKLQLDIPDDINKKLKIYRIENDLVNLQNALVDILIKFFDKRKK